MMTPILTRRDFNEGNYGDAYIAIGLQYLWEKAVDKPVDWLLLDKFNKGKDFDKFEPLIRDAGQLIIAGTPQYNNLDDWSFWYDENVWTSYVARWGLSAWTLAGGSGHASPHMLPEEFADYCAGSAKTRRILKIRDNHSVVTTVRDPHAHALLNRLHIENTLMPCTATWAMHKRGIKKSSNKYVALVAPSATHLSHEATGVSTDNEEGRLQAPADLMPRMYNVFKRMRPNVIVVCHGIAEYVMLRGKIPAEDLFYSNDSHSVLELYSQCELVVSARLHGALPAYGIGGTKVHMIGIDTRGSAAWAFPEIGYSKFPEVLALYGEPFETWCEATLAQEPGKLKTVRAAERKYVKLLRDCM